MNTPPIGYGYTLVTTRIPGAEYWCHRTEEWSKDACKGGHLGHCCVGLNETSFYRAPFVPSPGRVVVALNNGESIERGDILHFDDGAKCEADATIGRPVLRVFMDGLNAPARTLVAVTRAIQTKPEVKLAPFGVWTAFSKRAPLDSEYPVFASHKSDGASLFKTPIPQWGTFWKFWMRVEIPKLPDPADEAFNAIPGSTTFRTARDWFKLGWEARK